MFKVMDNGKDAIIKHTPGWDNNVFNSFEEAVVYCQLWVKMSFVSFGKIDFIPKDWDGSPLDYSGFGDTVSIQRVEDY